MYFLSTNSWRAEPRRDLEDFDDEEDAAAEVTVAAAVIAALNTKLELYVDVLLRFINFKVY